ncbi:MAG: P1 family peptidase [Trueperaceae bacterium]
MASGERSGPGGGSDRAVVGETVGGDLAGRRLRLRELGISPGVLKPGARNDITDVAGVQVSHVTLFEGEAVRTGVTAVLPHPGNPYRQRVPAGLAVGNGYGKLIGATQVVELGELETPIVLTNTLCAARAADALVTYMLEMPGNGTVRSINPFVGETNDGVLNDIRARAVTHDHVLDALAAAAPEPVQQGAVGAGTGTVAFGYKGGIGSASRRLPPALGGHTVGALVQTNFGGVLQVAGLPVGVRARRHYLSEELAGADSPDGSIMIVLATDAPLSDRNLTRLAARAMAGLARTGAAMSNGSGDYAVAFSTDESVRRLGGGAAPRRVREAAAGPSEVGNDAMSPLFLAAIEATEEAIYDSLCMATTTSGYQGRVVEALPLELLDESSRISRKRADE